jgi:hypothetical protein
LTFRDRRHAIDWTWSSPVGSKDDANEPELMLRRAIPITLAADVLSAACAFAFSPRLSRLGRTWGLGALERGHTPVPRNDQTRQGDSLLFQTQGGAPGTYCPIPQRNGEASQTASDQRAPSGSSLLLAQDSLPGDAKNDLLAPPAARCVIPSAATPVARSVVP